MTLWGPRKTLEIRLELNGRVLCEGSTQDLPPETTIGRAADCGWRIPPTDKTASNHHARLYSKRGKWYVEDTGSRNGMYCKGEKVASWCLSDGDQVSIGDCVLVAERAADKDASRAEYHRLEQLNGADAGRMIDLDRESNIIGSAPTCDIVCDDNLVSHRHAELACKRDGSCWVKDLKSRNGTRVNRVQLKVNERMLRDGDILSVAYVDFRFWDKNTTHTPSNIRLRAAVALMTLLVCLTGWFFWNAAHPSANYLLKQSLRAAERSQFREALRIADAARTARHHNSYGPQIQERLLDIRKWQDTAIAWDAIQDHLQNGRWVRAQKKFNEVKGWCLNTETAIQHKQRADCLKRLLDAFVEMRKALSSGHATPAELEAVRTAWTNALAEAEAKPVMVDPVWPIAYDAETGSGEDVQTIVQDTAYTSVWEPLREAGTAISAEIAYGIEARNQIRDSLERLENLDITSSPARACREEIGELHKADQEHKLAQTADQQEKGYGVLRFCPLAEAEYDRIRDALGELEAAEAVVNANLAAVAEMDPDGDNQLKRDLAFPTHTDEILFRDYQDALTKANSALCERKQNQLKTIYLSAFREMGLVHPGGTPTSIARLTRPETLREAMEFIDWRKPAVRWGGESPIPGCVYDEILGCKYTYDFLTTGSDAAADFLSKSPDNLKEEHLFCPVARQAREDYAKLKAFANFVLADPLLNAAATRLVPFPWEGQKHPNRLKQYYDRALTLLKERDNWLEETVEPCCGRKNRDRNGVLARVLYLVVSPRWDPKMHKEANDIRNELHRKHFRDAQDESEGLVEYLSECVPDKFFFTEWNEYAASHAPGGGEP